MELLEWGMSGHIANELSFERQTALFKPLESIVRSYGVDVCYDDGHIRLDQHGKTRYITVYPAMKREPIDENTIFISNQQIKYAKPFAVKKIMDVFGN